MTKAELRREMRRHLQTLGAARATKSRAICAAIGAHPGFLCSERIAIFSPLPGEPDVEQLWQEGAPKFCYPRVVGSEIEFVDVLRRGDLAPSAWNSAVREPPLAGTCVMPPGIDLILVPGLAFTRDGQRLGRGGGFYDRFLAQLPARTLKIGVCFDLQLVESIPVEAHDRPVNAVVTESGFVNSSR
jgi:5-formyltetrahydrofolate cyclo-ligase